MRNRSFSPVNYVIKSHFPNYEIMQEFINEKQLMIPHVFVSWR